MTKIDHAPPHDIDLEISILSTCLLAGGEGLVEIVDLIEPKYFYKIAHQKIFDAILYVHLEAESADIIALAERLKARKQLEEVGGMIYLSNILDYPIAVDIPYSCGKLEEKFLLRSTIENCYATIKRCHGTDDFNDIVDYYLQGAHGVSEGSRAGNPVLDMKSMSMSAADEYERRYTENRIVTGVPSGITELDMKTFGFHDGDLTVLAARPGMGKTAAMVNMIKNAADKGFGSLTFSLEMPAQQLYDRAIAIDTGINGMKIRIGNFTKNEFQMVNDSIGNLYKLPMFIDDRGGLTFNEIRKTIRRQIKLNPEIKIIFIDHLQLIVTSGSKNSNRTNDIGDITAGLKTLAKAIRRPIVLLSQLNREVERRNNPYKRPKASDLRDSGTIEQDADNIIFIYRPIVYNDDISPEDGRTQVAITETDCELIINKQRQGSVGTVNVEFHERCQLLKGIEMRDPDEVYRSELKKRENR